METVGPVVAFLILAQPPDGLDAASGFLLAHGMASPRGGAYREVDVRGGKVRGWLLPHRRLVTREGLTVAVDGKGVPADLTADVAREAAYSRRFDRNYEPAYESADRMLRSTVLLAAGERSLAERLAGAHEIRYEGKGPIEPIVLTRYLARWYREALRAHVQGDDPRANRVEQALLAQLPAFERRLGRPAAELRGPTNLAFLEDLPALSADTRRRLGRASPKLHDPVKSLIADLENVAAIGESPVDLARSPVLKRLTALGDRAVDPLLDAVETDRRLTRAVLDLTRESDAGIVLTAAQAERWALFQILGQPTEDIGKLRAYWAQARKKSPAERALDVLADDTQNSDRWREAARRLFGVDRPPAAGLDALRSRRSPSLGDLLERRARQAFYGSEGTTKSPAAGLWLAALDARWEGARALPLLQELTRASMDRDALVGDSDGEAYGSRLDDALEARAALGDGPVWREYAAWLPFHRMWDNEDDSILRPLLRHRREPAMQGLAHEVFLAPRSRFNLVQAYASGSAPGTPDLVLRRYLALPAVREAIEAGLRDETVVGESWAQEDGSALIAIPNLAEKTLEVPASLQEAASEIRSFRVQDRVALALTRLPGAPAFVSYWSEARKAAAIDRLRRFVARYGPRVD